LDFKPGLLLISYWMPFFAPALSSVAKKVRTSLGENVRVMALMHNVIPHEKRPWDVKLTKKFCKQVDGFIILNNSAQKDLMRLKPDADFLVHQHPLYNHYGEKVDQMNAREKLKIPLNKEVILFFGFIRDYKGLDILINAMKHMSDDYHLVIAGEVYGSFEKYRKIINENKLKDKITLHLEYIPENEITYFFSAADVCVLPYRSATQSGVTGIAYHFDLPVIATNVGGLTDLIEENQTGLIVQSLEDKDMADVIKHYFTNNMRLKMQPFVKMYKAKHSWDGLAKAIGEFYARI
jgi:glycosyltransferase involved in cell wall biosynthesis